MSSEEATADGAPMLSIIMPFLNEHDTLKLALEKLLATELPVPYEVVLVDDGSTDGSIETVKHLLDDRVHAVTHPSNRGKGAAILSGLAAASGSLATILDADLEYDPADYPALLEPVLRGEAEVVYGTRMFGSQSSYSFWYVVGNRVVTLWASFLFNAWLSDVETCFKLAPTEVWRTLNIRSRGFGIEAEVTGKFLRSGRRIFEVPISYRARGRADGKKLQWTDGVAALWILLRARLAPRPRTTS